MGLCRCGCGQAVKEKQIWVQGHNLAWARQLQRRTGLYEKWRQLVLARDGRRCTRCGSRVRLHVHHQVGWAQDRTQRFLVSNGQTLCALCHSAVHGRSVAVKKKRRRKRRKSS